MIKTLVSVIVATFRRKDSLKNALASLANQDYSNFEIVLVDDNDNLEWNNIVAGIVDEFKKNYPSIQLIFIQNHPNQGSAKTRNIGISRATGKYITFLDDDDLYYASKISNQVDKMESVDADFSISNLSLYNENETLSENRRRDYLLTKEGTNLLLCHLKYHLTGTDTMMFKTDYIKSFGGFLPIDVGDEFYLMIKAIESNGKFIYVDSCDVKAYVHVGESGLSSGVGKIDGENCLFEYKKKYFDRLSNRDVRYIKMRHHAVLAFAYKRNGLKIKFFNECMKSLFSSPIQCLKLFFSLK